MHQHVRANLDTKLDRTAEVQHESVLEVGILHKCFGTGRSPALYPLDTAAEDSSLRSTISAHFCLRSASSLRTVGRKSSVSNT